MELKSGNCGRKKRWRGRPPLAQVFFEDMARQYEGFFLPWSSSKHPLSLAAFVDGKMVAGAGGLIVPEYKMAGFFGCRDPRSSVGAASSRPFMVARLKIAAAGRM